MKKIQIKSSVNLRLRWMNNCDQTIGIEEYINNVLHEVNLNTTYQGGQTTLSIYPTFHIASRRPKFKPEMTTKTFRPSEIYLSNY